MKFKQGDKVYIKNYEGKKTFGFISNMKYQCNSSLIEITFTKSEVSQVQRNIDNEKGKMICGIDSSSLFKFKKSPVMGEVFNDCV